jgi:hypothetical protein
MFVLLLFMLLLLLLILHMLHDGAMDERCVFVWLCAENAYSVSRRHWLPPPSFFFKVAGQPP